jgi:Phosphoesterase family
MEKEPRKPAIALAALACSLALSPGASASATSASQQANPLTHQQCQAAQIKKRVKRWAWIPERRKVHGHRVVVRRHGRIVYRRARVWRIRAVVQVRCSAAPSVGLPTGPLPSLVPAPLLSAPLVPAQPVSPPLQPPVGGSPQPPLNTAAPAISGIAQEGQTLLHVDGSWLNAPTSESDQWLRCEASGDQCQPISGATSDAYMPAMGDVGHTIRLREIASNAAGPSAPATSTQSAIVTTAPRAPVNVSPPTISGIAQQGQTMAASQGGWTGSPTGFSYEWLRCDSAGAHCVAISLATTSRYSLAAADIGGTLRVAVVASNAVGPSSPATSAQTEVVTAAVQPPTNTSPPMISGTAEEGLVLTASPGNWSNSPTSYAYHWRRCNVQGIECVAISGASLSTYLVRSGDVGFTLRVKVIAYNAEGHSSAISVPSDVVIGPPTGSPAHVMVIVEENRNRSEVIGASNMPYLNSLANKYGNTTKWNGVAHPSLPNYLALISGSTEGVIDDGCGYSFVDAPTIGSELSLAGISWKAYLEELPEAGSEVCTSGAYAKKHNPFAYFPETNGPNLVPASQFGPDESSGQLPDLIFFVPNLINDGHDGTNEQVDNYLGGLVPGVLASSWYAEDGTIIITWDESNGEEEIPTVVIHGTGSGQVLTATGSHYGTLATIEDLYAVPLLGHAAGATTLAPLLK